jgi:uncharacterized protein YecT (DUF1311 family)
MNKCKKCHQKNNTHKMSCSTQKILVSDEILKKYYEQMNKEVHQNNSNLNK